MACWKIAPGEHAEHWDDCLSGALYTPNGNPEPYICIGWNEVGDARAYTTLQSLDQAFKVHFLRSDGTYQKPVSLWPFVNSIQIGDWILANKGERTLVGIGQVTGNYVPPGAPGSQIPPTARQHLRTVDWVWVGKCQLTYVLGQKAVHRISRDNIKHHQHLKDFHRSHAPAWECSLGRSSVPTVAIT